MTLNKPEFYATVRKKLGVLNAEQVAGFETILAAIGGTPLSWAAFKLATTWHETNKKMQPVVEAYWLSEAWRKANLRYYPWHGRGYVQLTWQDNYRKADAKCAAKGLTKAGDILANPELVMRPGISAFILHVGCDEGWFTGVKCSTVLPSTGTATRAQYMDSRTIINGRDKADLIEDYCQYFERALRDGGWA